MGYSADAAKEVKVTQFCKAISEFSLEYKTMREKLMLQRAKKIKEKERKKTRGKMIVEVSLLLLTHTHEIFKYIDKYPTANKSIITQSRLPQTSHQSTGLQ